MPDFWTSCGYSLLHKGPDGRLLVTDDYLRLYFTRPELALPVDADAAERALHASLMETPRRTVAEREIEAIGDADARENYRIMLRFRTHLLDAPTLESFYASVFRHDLTLPPDLVHHTAQVILRSMLDGAADGLMARAAEIFFRPQRVTIRDGAIMAADDQTIQRHADTGGFGDIGRFLREGRMSTRTAELDVLDAASADRYFERDERFDTVLQLNPGRGGCEALCRLLERWMAHFHGVRTTVASVREIPDEDWVWHVGLDGEATAILNTVYAGQDIDEERMRRIVGLFRVDFRDPIALRSELAGAPVFLGMAITPDGILRMKPQNLLANLPLAPRS